MLTLRELQLCQLDIALDIKQICEENHINYFLIGGTLLGAVRHKGFIPWDDDLDIGMLRSDYEKFIQVCTSKLPDHLFLQTWDTDPYYGFSFAKIMLKGTTFQEEFAATSKAKAMIFVDVFPFDNMPDLKKQQERQFTVSSFWGRLLLHKQGYDVASRSKNKVLHRILKIVSCLFSKDGIKRKIIQAQQKYANYDTKNVINSGSSYRLKEYFEKSGVSTEVMTFEGYDFNVPIGWKQLLTNMYGDYMQLPPIEKRGDRHKAVSAEIGKYIIRNKAPHEVE